MYSHTTLFLISFAFFSCQDSEKDTSEGVDCPAIALGCPDGQTSCDPETDDECVEGTLGEEPCTQQRHCMTE